MTPIESPYLGPRPFSVEDAPQFFGREREARDLVSYIYANAVVVFYAPSGAGKTSLLNAAVIRELQAEGDFDVLPPARISAQFKSATSEGSVNSYIVSALASWAAGLRSVPVNTLSDFLAQFPHSINSLGDQKLRLIIFDQFEEFFTTASSNALGERHDFWKQLREALENDRSLRVLLVLREEFLAAVQPYLRFLPSRPANFRLEFLNRSAALEAVRGPLMSTGRRLTAAAATKLVDSLSTVRLITPEGQLQLVVGDFVEPVQLQIVCRNLWRRLPADASEITEADLEESGNVDEALMELFHDAITQALAQKAVNERELRKWVEKQLITQAGTRGSVLKGIDRTAGIPNVAVEILERCYLIRAQLRAGATWYELTHDLLIEPVQRSNKQWFANQSWFSRWRAQT
jgi:hypothetical protein